MRHKRISRRELKEQIKRLQLCIQEMMKDYTDLKDKHRKLSDRFDRAGNEWEPVDGIGVSVNIKPEAWGQYLTLGDDPYAVYHEEYFLKKLTQDLVRAMLDNHYVQFYGHDGIINGYTIGAKIYVVPWDKVVMLRKQVAEEVKQE